MPLHGKRYRNDIKGHDPREAIPLTDAVAKLKSFKKPKFDQTVDIVMHLGIDTTQADQQIRSAISLPHGIGKSKRVIAFCSVDKVSSATEAGAIEAGGDELIAKIEGGWMDFDVAVAEPSMMKTVSKLGKVLGPKGLMPSPKAGTVTPDVAKAVREYAAGKLEFRADKAGNVHTVIGKMSFEPQKLIDNAQAVIDTVQKMKPSSVKGVYLKNVSISGTMTPGVRIAVS